MTTITPPTAPQPVPTTSGSAPVAQVQSPPPALARLPVGQLLQATVTSQSARDVFQVQTPMGQLTLQTPVVLPKGGVLVLQMQSHSPFQFQINSLNGAAPPLAPKSVRPGTLTPQTMGASTNSTGKAAATGQTAAAPKLAPGNVLQATLMRPLTPSSSGASLQTPGGMTSSATAPTGAPAGNIAATPLSGAATTSGKPTAATPAAPASSSPLAGSKASATLSHAGMAKGTPGGTSPASGYLPTGSQLSVKINSMQLPNPVTTNSAPETPTKPSTPPSLSAGTTLRGTVTGSTPSGHPIIQTRAGVFSLTTGTIVPRGSVLSLDVVTSPTAPATKPGVLPSLHETMFSSRKWPALEEVIQIVQENNPASAQQIVNHIVPRPNATLASGIIFFLSALRGGELRSLIGDDILRLIERVRPNLTGRMMEDFSSLARIADEPASGDWRVALIPLNTGSEIEQIRMLLRQHGGEEEEEDENGDSDTRFVLDIVLSRFGRLQLDGLVRNKGKSLDLIVRSEMPLAGEMQNDIRDIFQNAADLTGLNGGVNFQASPPDFIEIPDPTGDHDLGFIV